MASKTLITLEQFDHLAEREGISHELDEGTLLTVVRPLPIHSLVEANLTRYLAAYVSNHNLGLTLVEAEFQLSEDIVRIPDVAVILGGEARKLELDRRLVGTPTLAIEIVSETDLATDINRKVRQYLNSGSKAVWILYPKDRQVHIRRGSVD